VVKSHVGGLIDDISGEELSWEDFECARQDNIVEMTVMCGEKSHQVPELVFVDVATSPDEVHGASIPVVHCVEEIEQCFGGDDVTLTEQREWFATIFEPSILVQRNQVVNFVQVLFYKQNNIKTLLNKTHKILMPCNRLCCPIGWFESIA
jgi:hypothetical protein